MILKSFSFIGELLFLRLLGINIVWTVHNIASHEADFRSMELFFARLIKKFCNKIIVHTTFARSEVIRAYGVKDSSITVIPHGNYINYYENKMNRENARNHFRISTEDLVFLYFGRIRPYKGLPELIDAFKKLNHSQMRLLIVGEPFNNEIAKDVLKKCDNDGRISVILKFIPEDEIQIYMNTADVVVLPYRDILTSGAVILAMSFGKAIIAPAIGCIPDVLDSEGSFLYNPSDEDGLVKAMIKVLDSELDKMGQHNFQLANKLSWKDIGKKTYDVYSECLRI
jgi:glycosyltransferase involved in cell wall biosynthesis